MSEGLLRTLCAQMQLETGLRFDGSAADAFGSLEVYGFPSLDEFERPRVRVHYDTAPRTVTVSIQGEEAEAEYAVQVRGEQVRNIASDELQILGSGHAEGVFRLPDPLDGVQVRVWTRRGSARWTLWHEREDRFLRSVHTRMHLSGLSGTVGAPWLDKLSQTRNAALQSRVESYRKIRQVSSELPMLTTSLQPWESAIQDARELVSQLHPQRSKARFFPRGWGTDENKLAFAEWLKERLSSSAGSIVVIDPYFDVLGLDLLCRASGAARELVVLTSTQLRSEDDDGVVARSERLRSAACQYFSIVRGLKLRICDLRSAKSEASAKPLFHDRYLLIFDANGHVVEGYNLSTSLQSAATTTPLLVTEIPSDVLPDVAEYVARLRVPTAPLTLETLHPSDEGTRRPLGLEMTPRRAEAIVAALNAAGRDAGDETPAAAVVSLGVYRDDRVHLQFSDEGLQHLVQALSTSSLPASALVWEGMVESGLNGWSRGVPDLVQRLHAQGHGPAVTCFLLRYLEGHGTGVLSSEGSLFHTRTLAWLLERPFAETIGQAARFFDHHHHLPLGTTWAIHLALMHLIADGPQPLDELVNTLHQRKDAAASFLAASSHAKGTVSGKEAAQSANSVLDQVDGVLSAVPGALHWFAVAFGPGLPDRYSASRQSFVRALWAIMHARRWKRGEVTQEQLLDALDLLPEAERRLVLAQVIYEQRVEANQAQARGDEPGDLPDWLTAAVVDRAQPQSPVEEVIQLVRAYSGPSLGDWGFSTDEDLLQPMVAAGKLSGASRFDVWHQILSERMRDEHASQPDFQVLQVWGWTAWSQSPNVLAALVAADAAQLEQAHRTLVEPFVASRCYAKWSRAKTHVLWVFLRAWAIARARPVESEWRAAVDLLTSATDVVRGEKLDGQVIGEMQRMVQRVLEDLADTTPTPSEVTHQRWGPAPT